MDPDNPRETLETTSSVSPEVPAQQSTAPEPVPSQQSSEPSVAYVASAVASSPTNSNKQKMVVIVGSIGAGLLLLAGAVGAYFALTYVSKAEYQAAEKHLANLTRSYNTSTREVTQLWRTLSTSGDDTFTKSLDTAKTSLTSVKKENELLSRTKAVRFGEGYTTYQYFDSRLEMYASHAEELIQSVEAFRPAAVACEKVGDSSVALGNRVEVLDSCVAALGKVGDMPNRAFNMYYVDLKESYESYVKAYNEFIHAAPSSPEYISARSEILSIQSRIRALGTSLTTRLSQNDEEASVAEMTNELREFFRGKQKK